MKEDNGENIPLDIHAEFKGTAINITVPFGTDLQNLTAEYNVFSTYHDGVYVGDVQQISGVTVNDFSEPLVYCIKTDDKPYINFTVSVTVDDKQNETILSNRKYSDISSRNTCDVYLPENRYYNTPVIVFMHGGGWRKGDKNEFAALSQAYIKKRLCLRKH